MRPELRGTRIPDRALARKMGHAPRHGRGPKMRLQVQEVSDLGGAENHAKTFENNAQHKGIDSIARIYRGVCFYV